MLSTPQGNPAVLPGQSLFVFGFNPDVDTGSLPEDVWSQGGQVVFPSAAAVVDIVSTSALDTAAGTGAQAVNVVGVDGNLNIISEVVELDGLTPVATIQLFLFVNAAILATVGVLAANQGLLTFTIGGDLCNAIAVDKGQSQTCASVIPNALAQGTTAHLVGAFAMVGRQPNVLATISLTRRRSVSGIFTESLDIPVSSNGGEFNLQIVVPVIFAAGEQIVARITDLSANNSLVSAILQMAWLPA